MAKKKATTESNKRPAKRKKAAKSASTDVDKLQTLLEQEDSQTEVLAFFDPLTEKQRRELAPFCAKWYREQKSNSLIQDPPGTFRMNPLLWPAGVALFATATLSEIEKAGRWALPRSEAIVETVAARKPKWTDELVELLLKGSHYWQNWATVREMVRRKLCSKPDNPRYYTGMISGLKGNRWDASGTSTLEALENDPALLKDEVWRLFEHEGDGENTLATVDRWGEGSWSAALLSLAESKRLSRKRLLASSLGALELGFNHFRSAWFMKFYDSLEPTKSERKLHVETMLTLIGSDIPNIASWAFKHSEQMLDDGIVKDPMQLADAIAPAMVAKQKTMVSKGLKIYTTLISQSPESSSAICLLVADGLGHSRVDVQKSVFKFIAKHGSQDDEALVDTVRTYESIVGASIRKEVSAWCNPADAKASETKPKSSAATRNRTKATSNKRLAKHDPAILTLLSIPALQDAAASGDDSLPAIPATIFDETQLPRLKESERLEPMTDLEELLQVCGRVLEDDELIDDGERAIDGIVRLSGQSHDDLEKMMAPLTKRVWALFKRGLRPFVGESIRGDVAGLLAAWDHGGPVTLRRYKDKHGHESSEILGLGEPMKSWRIDASPLAYLSLRSIEATTHLGKTAVLLSAPTHRGGWIDPVELVKRVNDATRPPSEPDLVIALLRLAPERRDEAIQLLGSNHKGEWVNAIRYALGGKVPRIGKSAPLWSAAARAASPMSDDDRVAKAFPKLGQGAGKRAEFQVRYRSRGCGGRTIHDAVIETSDRTRDARTTLLTQLMQTDRWKNTSVSFWDLGTTRGSIAWVASIWPLSRDNFFATGAQNLHENLDWWEAAWHNRTFLEPLLDDKTPPGDMGMFMLLCGLAAKEPGEHGLAVDIAVRAIEDGRIGSDNLGRVLAEHTGQKSMSLSRLAKRFQEIATASPLCAYVALKGWENALPVAFGKEKKTPRGLGDVIEWMHETAVELGCAIESQLTRTYLESLKGSNKPAKAAKQLLLVQTTLDVAPLVETAIEGRLQRLDI